MSRGVAGCRARPRGHLWRWRLASWALVGVALGLANGVVLAGPIDAPTSQEPACQRMLLRPEDLEGQFELLGTDLTSVLGLSLCERVLARAARAGLTVEPEGLVAVVNSSFVGSNAAEADQVFDAVANKLFGEGGYIDAPVESVGDRQRGAAHWADGPYGLASTAVLFRRGQVFGLVRILSYGAPESTSEAVRLARVVAGRAVS